MRPRGRFHALKACLFYPHSFRAAVPAGKYVKNNPPELVVFVSVILLGFQRRFPGHTAYNQYARTRIDDRRKTINHSLL